MMKDQKMTALQRFSNFVSVQPNGCFLWTGSKNRKGYGQFKDRKLWIATRWVMVHVMGKDPTGLQVCHSCDTPSCVNPDHLWLGTQSENQIDAVIKGRNYNTKKTHCRKGHLYSPENTTLINGNERRCRACTNARQNELRALYGRSDR